MSGYLLDTYPSGATVYALFNTYNAVGASVTLTGLAVTDIEIYKNGSTTQRASDAGYTLLDTDGIDFDALTGIHGVSIDLNDNTDSGFYAVGSQYTVVVSSVTIDSQTVSFILGTFRIMAAEHTAGYPVATIKDGTGTGEIDTTSGGVLVAAIANNAITAASINADAFTAAKFASDVTTELQSGLATAASIAALNNLSAAAVNAEVVDALNTDTYAEPGQGSPGATITLAAKINYLYKAWRNRHTQTSSEYALYADDGTTKDHEAAVADNGTTFDRAEITTGA